MDTLFSSLPLELIVFAFGVTLVAGVVKGAVGFAMPLIMISGMGIAIDPKVVVAAIIFPIVMSNFLQVAKAGFGEARQALKDYAVYVSIVCVMILVSAQFLTVIPTETMFLVLGIPVTILCAIQIAGVRFTIPENRRGVSAVIAGFLSGALGGLAGTWGPTTVLYLVAVETPKARQIVVQGVVYGLGSVMLLMGHLKSGVMNAETWPLSALLLIPAFLGMRIGFLIQDRIDQDAFRKVTLWVLLIAGLNLVRRGLI
ncbi:sulfite exporter TauE/SafE family protein [Marivivens sp. LCG002]|uniref:sulfite exporter TauE/SafE family protein n=1 Tax=Marivivens sp. LCG002 TaxID=3051171 RepID=UPI00255257B7|nr:sulfite exporter TauE/SafE family protein [Marivivens sp. LCG002]WIV51048.1 sulfite exporter TauE/SafE family protein [Marivivens sp. LCG002]